MRFLFFRSVIDEDESLYEIQTDPGDPFVSYFPLSPKCENYSIMQVLHHGSVVIHLDEDGSRSAMVFLRLERNNGTLTWCKPPWSICKGTSSEYTVSDSVDIISPGFLMKYESSDISHGTVDDGFLDLASVKDVKLSPGDTSNVSCSKRYNIPEEVNRSTLRLLYGNSLSDNRTVELIAPSVVLELWHKGLEYVVSELKRQKMLSDRRMSWLKEKYVHLYFEDLVCAGPTPADAIKVKDFFYSCCLAIFVILNLSQ